MRHRKGWRTISLIAVLAMTIAITGLGSAATYESMRSYEDLLRSQTTLIGSFESLLKNSTLEDGSYNYHYQFLDSFDDLAEREQQGLASFEDLVSYNWSSLSEEEKISLTRSFEDLIRREATILSSNEDLLKRGFCSLNSAQKQELLDRFESRLKYEVVLYTKFDEWLQYQQMIEGTQKETWMAFLDSYEDLLRRQANLLASFEMLLKIKCDGSYLTLTKSVLSQTDNDVVYRYHISARNQTANIVITDQILGEIGTYSLVPAGFEDIIDITRENITCGECDNCSCNVCDFATVCGEVITPNGNFTTCAVSNQCCVVIDDYPRQVLPIIYPGYQVDDMTGDSGAGMTTPNQEMEMMPRNQETGMISQDQGPVVLPPDSMAASSSPIRFS